MAEDFDSRLKQDFIEEAAEMLDWVEDAFLEFEKDPDDAMVIDKIFRLAHTIKGSALSCGLSHLGEFAHVVETLLVKIRAKHIKADTEIVDVLLKANDLLTNYVAALRDDFNARIPTEHLIQEIQSLMVDYGSPETPHSGPKLPAFGLFDDDEAIASAAIANVLEPQSEVELAARFMPTLKGSGSETPSEEIDTKLTDAIAMGFKAFTALTKSAAAQTPPTPLELKLLQSTLEQLLAVKALTHKP